MSHPFLDRAGPLPYVHRGGARASGENTLEAFAQAHGWGYRYFETDVHVTADGVLVAFHDHSLRRTTGRRGRIADLTWAEVRQVRVSGESIPRLVELLESFPDVAFNIDPKHDDAVAPLARLLAGRRWLDRVCLASFSDLRLQWLRLALGPDVCTAMGPREVTRFVAGVRKGRPPGRRDGAGQVLQVPRRLGPARIVTGSFLEAAHDRGLPVDVWTVNEEPEMDRLLTLGVDGLMSDDPLVLRDVFQRRGLWPASTEDSPGAASGTAASPAP